MLRISSLPFYTNKADEASSCQKSTEVILKVAAFVSALIFVIGGLSFLGSHLSLRDLTFLSQELSKKMLIWGGVALAASIGGVFLHDRTKDVRLKKKSEINFNNYKEIEDINPRLFKEIKSALLLTPITFLNPFELHALHDNLTKMTESILNHYPSAIVTWNAFLSEIQQKIQFLKPSGELKNLNCAMEISRLNGHVPNLKMEELKEDSATSEELRQISEILSLSFYGLRYADESNVKDYLFNGGNACFLFKEGDQILGLVETRLRKETNTNGMEKTVVFIHSLARRPDAARLGMVKLFSSYIKQQNFDIVECEVYKHNTRAKELYEAEGLEVVKETRRNFTTVCLMRGEIRREVPE